MKKLTTVFAILVMAIAALADAGVGQIPSGGSAGIMGDDLGIRLAEETVVVELEKDSDSISFDVRAEFSLYNDGTGKSVFLFLPVSSIDYHTPERDAIMDGKNPAKETDRYDVWLKLNDSKLRHQLFVVRKLYDEDDIIAPEGRIAFQTNDGEKYALWPISRAADEDLNILNGWWEIWAVCSVDIPAGDSILRYHYTGVPSSSLMVSFTSVYYPLWSGASWSGTIGAGTVTYVYGDGFSVDDTFGGYSAPDGVAVEALSNGYRFSFEDYEPQPGDGVSIEVITKNELSYLSREGLRVAPNSDAAFVNGVESPDDYHRLVILDAQGEWLKLRAECQGKEVVGWVYGRNLSLRGEDIGGELEMVWSNPINFRTEPNSSAERVAGCSTIQPGYLLYFIERQGDWLRVLFQSHDTETPCYHHGWARWRYLDPDSGEELIYIESLF